MAGIAESHRKKVIHLPLLWLDPNVNDDSNKVTRYELQKHFGGCGLHDNIASCREQLQREGIKFVLIVSGQFGSELVPLIHDRPNIGSIYVYCAWKEKHEQWAKNYSKVKAVVTDSDELIKKIRADNST